MTQASDVPRPVVPESYGGPAILVVRPCHSRMRAISPHSIRAVSVKPRSATRSCRATAQEIAALIRRAREELGLTQFELAERMDSTQSTIARWEGGEHEITMKTSSRIAEALGAELVVRFGKGKASA